MVPPNDNQKDNKDGQQQQPFFGGRSNMTFDAKRLRKAFQRRTVDYNSNAVVWLEVFG